MIENLEEDAGFRSSMTYNYSYNPAWYYPSSSRRVRASINGSSESYGGLIEPDCTQFMNCIYTLEADAQTKNFWGSWVYGDYTVGVSGSGPWTFTYGKYSEPYCGLTCISYNSVPPHSCPSACPTSPLSIYYGGGINKLRMNLSPHSIWSASTGTGYFCDAFNVSYDLDVYVGGHLFNLNH